METGDAPRVSLVVPTRNEQAHIDACLRSLRAQRYPAERLEILVVDGDSTDGTVATVRTHMAEDVRIQLLHNRERAAPNGMNIGIVAARGEYVGVVSAHSGLPQDYVRRAVETIRSTGAWSIGGRIARTAETPMQHAIALATSSRIGVGDSGHNYAATAGWVETVFPGFWRRDVFERVGLFDPAMTANEDNELSHRIRRAGGRIWYEPSIEIAYVPRATLSGLFSQYRRYAMGKVRVLRKHHGGLRWRHLAPAAWLAALLGGAVVGVFVPWILAGWAIGVVGYLATILTASVRLQRSGVAWWKIAAALVTLHVAYGVGTWHGVLTWRG